MSTVEAVVEMQPLTGKWSAKYRYGLESGSEAWMMAGTQHKTGKEAADAVLVKVSALFPELTESWLQEARAGLSAD